MLDVSEDVMNTMEAEQQALNLQSAIEVKRQLYRTHYSTKNEATLKAYCSSENFLYVSSYAPMAIVSVTARKLKEIALDPSVAKISLFENGETSNSSLYNSNLNSRVAYVRDTYGNDGSGVKIGQIEEAVPDVSNPSLTSANITTNTSIYNNTDDGDILHAT